MSQERSQIELRAKQANQQLLFVQGNLKQLEIDRNKAQQQVKEFQAQKTALEQEREVILKQKQKAEAQNQKNQNELRKIELNLQVNRQKLEQSVTSLQTAEQLRQVAIKGTQLEREGTNIIRRFLSDTEDQIALLIESMKTAQELKKLVGNSSLDQYPAISPLNALHNILDYSREKNRFGGIIYTYKFVVIPNHQHLAFISTFGDTTAIIDLKGNVITRLKSEFGKDSVREVAFSSKGRILAPVAMDNTTRILDFDGKLLAEFKVFEEVIRNSYGLFFSPVLSMVFSPDAKLLATGMRNNTVRLWDLKGNLIEKFKGHEQSVKSVAFSLDGLSIFSSSDDETVRVWDLQSSFIREFKEHWPNVRSITFNRDGNLIATASENQAGRVWDLQGNLIVKLEGHQDWVTSIAFSPDSQFLFTSSWDKKIRIWNRQGSLIREFKAYDEYINDMILSPNGKLIATVPMGDTVKLWDIKGNLLKQFKFKKSIFLTINFSHNSKLLAMGLSREVGRLEGIQGKDLVLAVVLDLDGNIVTKLKGNVVREFRGHRRGVSTIAFSPDGKYLVSGASDGTARLWRVETLDELLARGCYRLSDYFISHPKVLKELPVCKKILHKPIDYSNYFQT